VSFKAFTQQTLFEGFTHPLSGTESMPEPSDVSRAPFDHEICARIKGNMKTKEYYLNQNLTIHDFARDIQVSARTISSCINQSEGFNFNEWVNNYRVDKALEILKDPNSHHLSIEGIGIDSGFKSRSAMYAAFRRKFGKSPGNFR
jgi:AraC-like DNA-binding protein